MTFTREQLTEQIIHAGGSFYMLEWMSPATSSNYSARVEQQPGGC